MDGEMRAPSSISRTSTRPVPGPGKARRRRGSQPRTSQANIRCSEAELTEIDRAAAAAGLSRGAFVMETVMASIQGRRGPVEKLVYQEALDQLMSVGVEVAKVGRNLNQIARRVNAGESVVASHAVKVMDEVLLWGDAIDDATAVVQVEMNRKR